MEKVYMKVTNDKYELPVAVALSVPELAKMTGLKTSSIFSAISHKEKTLIRVEIEIEDEDE